MALLALAQPESKYGYFHKDLTIPLTNWTKKYHKMRLICDGDNRHFLGAGAISATVRIITGNINKPKHLFLLCIG